MSKITFDKHQKILLSGNQVDNFGYLECIDGSFDIDIVKNIILNGNYKGNVLYIIRNYADKNICSRIADSFDREVKKSGGNRPDDGFVLTNQIGATQFARSGEQYTEEVNSLNQEIMNLLSSVSHSEVDYLFFNKTLETIFIQDNIHFGPARFKSSYSCFATFRRWLDNGVMSLMPHEDKAQLKFADMDNFEIGAAETVTAYNVCLEAATGGGELQIWNLSPDDECRKRLGVTDTGYPYPPEMLTNIERLSVKLNVGDIYFMNACYLHGVSSVNQGHRLTAGRFIGKLSDQKVIYWT
ncbi:L-isoleucine 3(1)-dioxygenase [Xenorhabdus entomophaga]|uniref:L-isoleucine 3(1)-dioxygenase n=1 Tax=Xenorhabdus entomophaga TaxID=3136257 RepID=UPI0030F381EC